MDKNKLILPITILLVSIILGGFYYASEVKKQQSKEYDLFDDEFEIDTKSETFKENFLEGCLEGGEELASREYCECSYDYLTDNYDSKEITRMAIEMLQDKDKGLPIGIKDAFKACKNKL